MQLELMMLTTTSEFKIRGTRVFGWDSNIIFVHWEEWPKYKRDMVPEGVDYTTAHLLFLWKYSAWSSLLLRWKVPRSSNHHLKIRKHALVASVPLQTPQWSTQCPQTQAGDEDFATHTSKSFHPVRGWFIDLRPREYRINVVQRQISCAHDTLLDDHQAK